MLNKLIENQAKDASPCEKVLGSTPRVNNMAALWDKHATLFKLMAADALLDYTEAQIYTSEECAAFRLGLSKIPELLASCSEERKKRIQEESLKDSKKA